MPLAPAVDGIRRSIATALRPPLILCYHGIGGPSPAADPHRLLTPLAEIERHIAALDRLGYSFVTFSQIAGRNARGEAAGCACVTFDDALASVWEQAVPMLLDRRVPATAFVPSGLLGRVHPDLAGHYILNEGQVRQLHLAGIEIGSHSVTHANLTGLAEAGVARELGESREQLEGLIGAKVEVLAYPFGRSTETTRRLAGEAGYLAACAVSGGTWKDQLMLPRALVGSGSGIGRAWAASHERAWAFARAAHHQLRRGAARHR